MERTKKVKPRDFAMEQIQWYICEHKLGPHAKLPGERELCEMWGLNRSTLRGAIRRLIEENILYSEKGAGTYVAAPKFRMHLQDVKSTTEAFRGTGNFLWTEVVKAYFKNADAILAERLNIAEGDRVFCLKRVRRKNNVPFRIEESYLNYGLCEGIEERSFTDESLFQILRNAGLTPDRGNEEIGISYVSKEEAQLLGISEGQYVFKLQGITVDDKGRCLEFFRSLTRADQVQFSSILKRKG